jgi:hypothetical protein
VIDNPESLYEETVENPIGATGHLKAQRKQSRELDEFDLSERTY